MRRLGLFVRGNEANFQDFEQPASCQACHYPFKEDEELAVVRVEEGMCDHIYVIHDDEICFVVFAAARDLRYEPKEF